jgi:HD-GYP domain-containing protein (c-di-GMP phosphodiesterase class II)
MLRLPSDQLRPGMIVGRNIIGANERVLLTSGQVLTERYIQRIKDKQIPMVYIEDPLGINDSTPLVSPSIISEATLTLREACKKYITTGKANLAPVQIQVNYLIDDLLSNSNLLIGVSDLKNYDDYTYQHSVGVCALAITIGINNGYNRAQLQTLGTGALLHDIGKINIPIEILHKPGALTDDEYNIIQKHSWDGYKIISSSFEIPTVCAQVALTHHERIDGKGYPQHLSGVEINDYALIVAVVDTFDALVSDRPYRRCFNNQEAMNIIEKYKNSKLSPKFVDVLHQHVNIFTTGTVITLNTGDIAVITKENSEVNRNPQVKLLFSNDQKFYDGDYTLDLAFDKKVFIRKIQTTSDADEYISLYLSLKDDKLQHSTE